MRIVIGILLAALFLAGAAFIGIAIAFLDNAIALAGSAALGSAFLIVGVYIQLARIERYQHEQVELLRQLTRPRRKE